MSETKLIADHGLMPCMRDERPYSQWLASESTVTGCRGKALGVHDISTHGTSFNADERAVLRTDLSGRTSFEASFSAGIFALEDELKLRPDIWRSHDQFGNGDVNTIEADLPDKNKVQVTHGWQQSSYPNICGDRPEDYNVWSWLPGTKLKDRPSQTTLSAAVNWRSWAANSPAPAVFRCFPQAMTALGWLGLYGRSQLTLARNLSDHTLQCLRRSLSTTIKSRRFLECIATSPARVYLVDGLGW